MSRNLLSLLTAGVTILSLCLSPSSVAAQSSTPSSLPGAGEATDSATTEELRKRIERVVEERREQIKGVVDDLLGKKGGYIGEITRISEGAITVETNNIPNIIPLTESVVILQGTTPLNIESIEVGNWAVVLGTRNSTSIDPEYVLVSESSPRPDGQYVRLGSIKSIDRTELVLTPRATEEEQALTIQRTTKFQDADGSQATAADFDEELNVLVVAVEGKDGWLLKTVRSLAPLTEDEE